MFDKRILAMGALFCLLALPARAAEVESGDIYCFQSEDFSQKEIRGICITGLPEEGTVCLGSRIIRPGDVLPAQQLEQLTFQPARRESDAEATLSYLPVLSDGVGEEASLTISIRGRENKSPVAEDHALETYKNLPLDGKLKVKDPEGETMTFQITRQPKRGTVEIREDGSFTYTPKKNKVGIDSFVYTATDASGKVSREATVTITIVKPTDSEQYRDTVGQSCRFAAEWMKNTGIFVGEQLDGNPCFQPDRSVSRGEFLTMLVKTLEIPTEEAEVTWGEEVPKWLQPYLAAALRAGITAGLPQNDMNEAVTGVEAATMIQNALDLPATEVFAFGEGYLTRADAAIALYQTSRLAEEAPGMIPVRKQR